MHDRTSPVPTELTRRAAACVRACEGIPTECLEDDVIVRLVAAVVHVADDRVREVLEELSPRSPARGIDGSPARTVSTYGCGPQRALSRARISSTPSIDMGRPTQ